MATKLATGIAEGSTFRISQYHSGNYAPAEWIELGKKVRDGNKEE